MNSPRYRVCRWDELYENNRTREYKTLAWWPCPNDLGTDNYTAILDHPDGAAHYGAWTAILCVASTTKPRGLLVRENGAPHDATSLARITRMPFSVFEAALPRFLDIGLLEDIDNKPPRIKRVISQRADVKPQSKYAELNRKKEKKEKKRTEQKEQNGTNGTELKLDPSPASQKPAKTGEVDGGVDSQKILELKKQMAAIRGQEPPQWAVDKVLAKLAEWNASILGFAIYLMADTPAKNRADGTDPVRTWEWFVSVADNYGQMPEPAKPGHIVNPGLIDRPECHHGKVIGQCSICLPKAVQAAMTEVLA